MNRLINLSLISVILLIFLGCVSIPPEAPQLSVELGNRITSIQEANLTLLHRFFDLKRTEIDRFIQNEWMPIFVKEVFLDSTIKKSLETIVSENNPTERSKFFTLIGPRVQHRIYEKHIELIKPLDELERQIEEHLRDEYAQIQAINNSITSFLLSTSKVVENRNKYLEMVGVTDEKISNIIDEVDDAVNDYLSSARKMEDKVEIGEDYLRRIRDIKKSLNFKIQGE